MRKIIILLVALLLTTTNKPVFAKKSNKDNVGKQTQKVDIKEWSKRKKQMDPLQLKDLVEENHRLKTQNQKLEEKVTVYKEELAKTVKLKAELEELKVLQSKKGPSKGSQEKKENDYDEEEEGEAGVYVSTDDDHTGTQEEEHAGTPGKASEQKGKNTQQGSLAENGKLSKGLVFKVQVGAYEDYWEANKLKEELRAQGKKTWIVVFKDGKRIPLKSVLGKVTKKIPNKGK